jgi:hypothetical protein
LIIFNVNFNLMKLIKFIEKNTPVVRLVSLYDTRAVKCDIMKFKLLS